MRSVITLMVGVLAGLATFFVGADVALAHHPVISGVPKCSVDAQTYTVTWTVTPDAFRGLTWTIDGVTKPDSEAFTYTVTYNLGSGVPSLTKTATWSNGGSGTTTGYSKEPETCLPPSTVATTTTTTVPETTTTTTTVPEVTTTTSTVPEGTTTTTTTVAETTTTTQPVVTSSSSVAQEPPVPPVTTPPSSSAVAQDPPVLTVPPGSQLPVTGSSRSSDALTIALVLLSLGSVMMFARRRPSES